MQSTYVTHVIGKIQMTEEEKLFFTISITSTSSSFYLTYAFFLTLHSCSFSYTIFAFYTSLYIFYIFSHRFFYNFSRSFIFPQKPACIWIEVLIFPIWKWSPYLFTLFSPPPCILHRFINTYIHILCSYCCFCCRWTWNDLVRKAMMDWIVNV